MKKIKIIFCCVVAAFISSCVQNEGGIASQSSFNRSSLGSDFNNTYHRASINEDSEVDEWEDEVLERRRVDKMRRSSKRQRQFVSENGESLRDKLESKEQ